MVTICLSLYYFHLVLFYLSQKLVFSTNYKYKLIIIQYNKSKWKLSRAIITRISWSSFSQKATTMIVCGQRYHRQFEVPTRLRITWCPTIGRKQCIRLEGVTHSGDRSLQVLLGVSSSRSVKAMVIKIGMNQINMIGI